MIPIQTSDESEEEYPTDWRWVDAIKEVEVRQLTEDIYQLRSKTHTLNINQEGFDLYRDSSLEGHVIFLDWCSRNNIVEHPREETQEIPLIEVDNVNES